MLQCRLTGIVNYPSNVARALNVEFKFGCSSACRSRGGAGEPMSSQVAGHCTPVKTLHCRPFSVALSARETAFGLKVTRKHFGLTVRLDGGLGNAASVREMSVSTLANESWGCGTQKGPPQFVRMEATAHLSKAFNSAWGFQKAR